MMGRPGAAGRSRRALACAGVAVAVAAAIVPGVPAGAASPAAGPSTTTTPAPSLGDLTTYAYGNARSDNDTVDPAISKLSAGPAWDASLDAGVYGQPLVYDATVYVGTENDTVYAIGAKTGKVIWKLHVGTPASTSVVDSAPTLSGGCGDINPLGITGTPVIDAATDEIFAAEETVVGADDWQDIQHWLVAVSLATHKELWHRQVDPPMVTRPVITTSRPNSNGPP